MPLALDDIMVSSAYHGLSSMDAEIKAKEFGKNIRPKHRQRTALKRFLGIVSEPMLLLLIATAVVYYFVGSLHETVILVLSIIPIIFIEYFQESKTDKAIEILDTMLVEECQVMRDGVISKLPSSEIVPGDLVFLYSGSKIPADGVLVESPGLMVDESVLTGESIPVVKTDINRKKTENDLFQGTMVVQGEGRMVVTAIGPETSYGKLGNLLEGINDEPTPLQKKIQKLVRDVAVGAIITALFIGFVVGQRQGFVKGLLGTLTIAMSIIPEEFPIVFSVFLIMGVWRLSKRKALVRKMVMVETLGSATVICTDKTGTLTEGKMSLEKVYLNGQILDVNKSENYKLISPLVESAVLAFEQVAIDPMEIEMQRFAKESKVLHSDFYSDYKIKMNSAFDAATRRVSHIWENKQNVCHQYTAGAPESVIDVCQWDDEKEKEKVIEVYKEMAKYGYRIVGIAKTPSDCKQFMTEKLHFAGLVMMSDPPREGVKEAVATCYEAGIRVIMITGDHALTAKAVAERIGMHPGEVVEGRELEGISQDTLYELIKKSNIFARVKPEQKYLIVEALQANENTVAMTGDGVNDAPALKKANIGIAMGQKGTDVARAASGIVLMNDNFTTIVKAVEEGRRIYDNLRKAFLFLFSFHLPIVGLAVVPLLIGQDLYFLPIHIIFLEFFCDPTTVIGFERDPVSRGAMRSPPRPANEPLVNRDLWWRIGWQASGIFALTLWFYSYGLWNGNILLGRTLSFIALVVAQIVLVIVNRDWEQVRQNHVLTILLALTVLILHIAVFVPIVRGLFHFVPISRVEYLSTIIAALVSMVFFNKISKDGYRFHQVQKNTP